MGEVRFSYMKEKPILRGVDLDVPEGSMVAIVGPSGCGKTTMLKLIARFYDVDDGAVRIGGVDVRDMTTEDLFARVSFVFQDVYLFNDTLRNNVLMANPDASEEQLRAVADLAGVTEVVERLPGGWETLCGEGGRSLSGGERQRVSIARALLKQAPIVLLDEATSALDAENEKNVVRSIETLKRRSTLIVVAHKLETVRMADKIVVMDSSGKVAETGTHNELIALEGEYKDFWDKRNASSQWQTEQKEAHMKLKDIATIAVLGVIGFALGMGVGMITGMFGALSMYVSAGFAAFFVGPVYTIMARKVQKRGTAFCFWLIYGVLYAIMGFAVATPLCLIAGIVAEIIAGDYGNKKRVWLSFSASMFIYSMHMIVFVLVLGSDGLATFVESISLEQAQQMVSMYTVDMMVICVLINIVTELLAGRFGMFINDKFFEKGAKESRLG